MTIEEKEKYLETYKEGWYRRIFNGKIYWYYSIFYYFRFVDVETAYSISLIPDNELEIFLRLQGWDRTDTDYCRLWYDTKRVDTSSTTYACPVSAYLTFITNCIP